MSKSKKTPEQEEETKGKAPATPEEDPKPAEETPKDGKPEEKPAEEVPEDKGNPEEKPSEEKPEDAEDPKKDEEKPAEEKPEDAEQPKGDPAKDPAPAATSSEGSEREAQLEAELLEARGQLAAYAAGVDPSKVGDAVILATAEAQKEGDLTEAGVTKAMANVLKRHPEWKASGSDGKKSSAGGFKLGADPDKSSGGKKSGDKSGGNSKRWNRFK